MNSTVKNRPIFNGDRVNEKLLLFICLDISKWTKSNTILTFHTTCLWYRAKSCLANWTGIGILMKNKGNHILYWTKFTSHTTTCFYLGPLHNAWEAKPMIAYCNLPSTTHFIEANNTGRYRHIEGSIWGKILVFFTRHFRRLQRDCICVVQISKMARCRPKDKYGDSDWLVQNWPITKGLISDRGAWNETVLLILPAD